MVEEKVSINKDQHDLIRGVYSPEDAREILSNLIDKKISFYTTRIFSQDVRFGERDARSEERVAELKQSREEILNRIAEAEKQGAKVKVNAEISLEIV